LPRIRWFGGVTALTVALAACTPAPGSLAPAGATTDAAIGADDMRHRIEVLAHDSLRGRDTGTPEIDLAAEYIAGELTRLGLRPVGDGGTFFQRVPLERRSTSASVSVADGPGSGTLTADEILPVSGIGGLPNTSRLAGSGPLVFGGHLIDSPLGADELAAEQLAGAVVIVRLNPPAGVDPNTAPPRIAMAALFSPVSTASAVLLVAEEAEEGFWDYASEIAAKGAIFPQSSSGSSGPTAPPFFLITPAAAERLLGASLAQASLPRAGLGTLEFSIEENVERFDGRNVVAVLTGADPARAGEYVSLGAHYDHVGVGTPLDGDSIFNGADDNASGTAALLEVAEALAYLPQERRPSRSVLFAWVTAEESGLLGSEYFTDRPTVRRESIISHINLDMIGRNHPDTLYSVGSRRISTELGEIVETVNARRPRPFVFNFEYDAPGHPEQIYCRSDHYNYARYGIPILFLTTGLHDQYHAPSDEAELIDADKAARVTSLVYEITVELANRASRPVIDQTVPPIGAPCS
jgi:hypothetical protein